MEEVIEISAEELAETVVKAIEIVEDISGGRSMPEDWNDEKFARSAYKGFIEAGECHHTFATRLIVQAIQTATQREREEKEKLCKQLEFTNTFMKTRIEDSLTLQALIKDNQELVDQVRLER